MVSVSLCLLALAGGCDSDDGDGTLPSVTIREFNKKCQELDAWMETQYTDEEICKGAAYESIVTEFTGMTAPELQAHCQMATTACLNRIKSAAAMPAAMTMPSAMCKVPPSTCTATLTDWDACQRSIPEQVKRFLGSLPACDKVTFDDLAAVGTKYDIEDSAACKTFEMKCSAMAMPSMASMMMKK